MLAPGVLRPGLTSRARCARNLPSRQARHTGNVGSLLGAAADLRWGRSGEAADADMPHSPPTPRRYRPAADRRYQRKLLLDSLTVNVPKDLRSDYYINTKVGRIVEIVTWGRLRFEFAHFTDRELADAMCKIAKAPYPHDRSRLIRGINMQRTA
jgi:hypothetical protein